MVRPALALTASLLLAGTAMAADSDGNFAIKGGATVSCAEFVSSARTRSEQYWRVAGWLEGYLTGVNHLKPETYDIAPWESTGLLLLVVEKACERVPDNSTFRVIVSAVNALEPNRVRERTELVEAKVGDKAFRLYEHTVRRIQEELNRRGHYNGPVDGDFGKATETALKAFQKEVGLEPSGVPNQVTLFQLLHIQS